VRPERPLRPPEASRTRVPYAPALTRSVAAALAETPHTPPTPLERGAEAPATAPTDRPGPLAGEPGATRLAGVTRIVGANVTLTDNGRGRLTIAPTDEALSPEAASSERGAEDDSPHGSAALARSAPDGFGPDPVPPFGGWLEPSEGDEAAATSGSRAHARESGLEPFPDAGAPTVDTRTTEGRVAVIRHMMSTGEYVTGRTPHELAASWGLSAKRVRDLTAEASRQIKAARGGADEAEAIVFGCLEDAMTMARRGGDAKALVSAAKEYAALAGIAAPQKVQVSGLADLLALAFAQNADADADADDEEGSAG
jgi:hypothetical protein